MFNDDEKTPNIRLAGIKTTNKNRGGSGAVRVRRLLNRKGGEIVEHERKLDLLPKLHNRATIGHGVNRQCVREFGKG